MAELHGLQTGGDPPSRGDRASQLVPVGACALSVAPLPVLRNGILPGGMDTFTYREQNPNVAQRLIGEYNSSIECLG